MGWTDAIRERKSLVVNKKHIFLCQLADAVLIPVRGQQAEKIFFLKPFQ